MLLFPAFRLQEKMQKMTLGERTWVKINEKIQEGRRRHEHVRYNNNREKEIRPKISIPTNA